MFRIHFILSIEMRDFNESFLMTFCKEIRFEFQQKFKEQAFIINVQTFVERILNLKKNKKKIKKSIKIKVKREIFSVADFSEKKFKDNKIRSKNNFNFNKNFINEKDKHKQKFR